MIKGELARLDARAVVHARAERHSAPECVVAMTLRDRNAAETMHRNDIEVRVRCSRPRASAS